MHFSAHQHGGSRLYSYRGSTGASVLFLWNADQPIAMDNIAEAGVHLPTHEHTIEVGECPYVTRGHCRYIHVSVVEKRLFISDYNDNGESVVRDHLTDWYVHYIGG